MLSLLGLIGDDGGGFRSPPLMNSATFLTDCLKKEEKIRERLWTVYFLLRRVRFDD